MKLLRMTAHILITLLVLTGCSNMLTSSPFEPDDLDTKVLAAAAGSKDLLTEKGKEIWSTSYKLDEVPVILLRVNNEKSQYAFLIGFDSAPEGARLFTNTPASLGSVYFMDDVSKLKGEKDIPYYDFFFNYSGKKCYLMKYPSDSNEEFNAEDWTRYYLHEGFHRYQMSSWKPSVLEENQDINGYPYLGENLASILYEHELLTNAVKSTDDVTCRSFLRKFASVRKLRKERWPTIANLEENQERIEGTARYLEHRIDAAAGWKSPVSVEQYLELYSIDGASKVKDEIGFVRFYSTGAAIGLLMDRLKIEWRDDIEKGQSPHVVLVNKLGTDSIVWSDLLSLKVWPELLKKGQDMAKRAEKEPPFNF